MSHIPYGVGIDPKECPHGPNCETSTKGQWQNWEEIDNRLTGRYNYIIICLLCGNLRWSEWVKDLRLLAGPARKLSE